MQTDKDNAPLQKALLVLRDDMTLQISAGEQSLEVHLTCEMAYGFVQALLANAAELKPWSGHPDAEVIEAAHETAFVTAKLAAFLQSAPTTKLNATMSALLAASLRPMAPSLAVVIGNLSQTKGDREQTH